MIFSLDEIINHARHHSEFYKNLYRDIPIKKNYSLEALPKTELTQFWQAAVAGKLLSSQTPDGVVFKSGGSTGSPKFSYFSRDEWRSFVRIFGQGMHEGGSIHNGDRVANLFYAGDLYASFLFINDSIEASPAKVSRFPIGGKTPFDEVANLIEEFKINVLAGVPSSFIQFAAYLDEQKRALPSIERILFGGESMHQDQLQTIRKGFGPVECRSVGWASVDGGLLGYSSLDCQNGEHRVFCDATIIEIVDDESGEVIQETGKPGTILLTNLTRKLMPIIRYPAGDRAQWVDQPNSKNPRIKLMGRAQECARIGPVSLYLEDVREALHHTEGLSYDGFQLRVTHFKNKDHLEVIVASRDPIAHQSIKPSIRDSLNQKRPMLLEVEQKELIHSTTISVVGTSELLRNPRTGKLRALIDERLEN